MNVSNMASLELAEHWHWRHLEPDKENPGTGYALYGRYLNAAAAWATQSEGTHGAMELLTTGNKITTGSASNRVLATWS